MMKFTARYDGMELKGSASEESWYEIERICKFFQTEADYLIGQDDPEWIRIRTTEGKTMLVKFEEV